MNNIKNYTIVGLVKNNSIDFVNQLFRLYSSGNVVAFLDSENTDITDGIELKEVIPTDKACGWSAIKYDPIDTDQPAQIVYSSGTEGKPKALLLSHRALADVVQRLNIAMQVDDTIREYIGVPVTYSFGLGRCRSVAAAGGQFFIPANGFNPSEIKSMLDADEINAISAVPSLWRMILQNPESIGSAGKKVRWIEIGSQYMSRSEKEQMKSIFPNAKIIQHYGLTEASRTTFLDVSKIDGEELESVGKSYGNVEIDISPDNRIKIRGPHVALGVIVDGLIEKIIDDDEWFTTNDNGHIKNGYLYYEGRSDDLINLAGVKINPDQLQTAIETELQVENVIAICKISDDLRGEGIFIGVTTSSGLDLNVVRTTADEKLNDIGINASSSLVVSSINNIPRTSTGKLQRKVLAEQIKNDTPKKSSKIETNNSVIAIYKKIFPRATINNNSNFKDLGGDSLNYVQLTMMLEKYLGHLPKQWDLMPIRKLEESKVDEKHRFPHVETASFLRALAILFIVGTHSGVEILGGGTLLLIFLVGYNFSRFKSRAIIDGNIWPSLWAYLRPVLIPYYILAAIYLYWNKSFEIDVLLLYANLLEAKITVVFPFWFVQILVQCLLIVALLFSLNASRSALKKSPWTFSFTTLIVLMFIRLLYPFVWDTSLLNNLVPLRFMAIIWLGWCFYYADTPFRKGLLVLCSTIFAFIDTGLRTETLWLIVGSISMAYIPYIKSTHSIKNAIHILASATFYIFVFNGIFIYIILEVLKIDSSLIAFVTGLTSSLFIWWVLEYLNLSRKINLRSLLTIKR